MRPRTTMQQWPCAMWGGTAAQSERVGQILLAIAQVIMVVW